MKIPIKAGAVQVILTQDLNDTGSRKIRSGTEKQAKRA